MRPTPSGRRRPRPDEGDLEVFVSDEQADHPVEVERWATLARSVLDAEGIRGDAEMSILFVDEATIAELNSRFMGVSGPTDVLSFPLDQETFEAGRNPDGARSPTGPGRNLVGVGSGPLLLGDIVICPAVAARNAPDHAGNFDDEMALLVVHGILHVLGMDHETAAEATEMRAKERDLLERFHGPVAVGTEIPGDDPEATDGS